MWEKPHTAQKFQKCGLFFFYFDVSIQNILVRIKNNIYPGDDPCGRVSILPCSWVFGSVHTRKLPWKSMILILYLASGSVNVLLLWCYFSTMCF